MKSCPAAKIHPRFRARRWAGVLLVFVSLYLAACLAVMWDAVRPKARVLFGTPARYGAPYENVSFRSRDGTLLKGWYVRGIPGRRGAQGHGVIVLCHGISSNRSMMLDVARFLYEAGFDVLLFDFRACGQSEGDRYTIGFREPDDVEAAVGYLRARPDIGFEKIGVLGVSAGAATALQAAARDSAIAAVVAESPYARLDRAVNNRFRIILGSAGPVVLAPARCIGEWLLGCSTAAVSPLRDICRIAPRPVLLIQDGEDVIAPPEETRDLLTAAGPGASLWFVPRGRHACACEDAHAAYVQRVTRFFRQALDPSPLSPASGTARRTLSLPR